MTPVAVLFLIVIPAAAGLLIGRHKGHPWAGLFSGLIVSWLGVLAVALWRPSHAELVRRERARLDAEAEARQGQP